MVVRIRLRPIRGRTLQYGASRTTLMSAALLTPAAVMAGVLGGWRLMADLKWTGEFAIRNGIFSHWQVWAAAGIGIQFIAFLLSRLGREDDRATEGQAKVPQRGNQAA